MATAQHDPASRYWSMIADQFPIGGTDGGNLPAGGEEDIRRVREMMQTGQRPHNVLRVLLPRVAERDLGWEEQMARIMQVLNLQSGFLSEDHLAFQREIGKAANRMEEMREEIDRLKTTVHELNNDAQTQKTTRRRMQDTVNETQDATKDNKRRLDVLAKKIEKIEIPGTPTPSSRCACPPIEPKVDANTEKIKQLVLNTNVFHQNLLKLTERINDMEGDDRTVTQVSQVPDYSDLKIKELDDKIAQMQKNKWEGLTSMLARFATTNYVNDKINEKMAYAPGEEDSRLKIVTDEVEKLDIYKKNLEAGLADRMLEIQHIARQQDSSRNKLDQIEAGQKKIAHDIDRKMEKMDELNSNLDIAFLKQLPSAILKLEDVGPTLRELIEEQAAQTERLRSDWDQSQNGSYAALHYRVEAFEATLSKFETKLLSIPSVDDGSQEETIRRIINGIVAPVRDNFNNLKSEMIMEKERALQEEDALSVKVSALEQFLQDARTFFMRSTPPANPTSQKGSVRTRSSPGGPRR